mmetsp:Transcript_3276/g.4382  ORF Transcript_3276/g.4382 Transcript_3276/m.4382 type:complete len:89 (-) Transcript_3276:349-615(-)
MGIFSSSSPRGVSSAGMRARMSRRAILILQTAPMESIHSFICSFICGGKCSEICPLSDGRKWMSEQCMSLSDDHFRLRVTVGIASSMP